MLLAQVWLQQIKCCWRENVRVADSAMKLSDDCRDLLDKVGHLIATCLQSAYACVVCMLPNNVTTCSKWTVKSLQHLISKPCDVLMSMAPYMD